MAAAKEVAVQGHVVPSRGGRRKTGVRRVSAGSRGSVCSLVAAAFTAIVDRVDESHAGQPAVPSVAAVRVFSHTNSSMKLCEHTHTNTHTLR